MMDDECGVFLGEIIVDNESLQNLLLQGNLLFGDVGCDSILQRVNYCGVTALELTASKLTVTSAKNLAKCLKNNRTLGELLINYCDLGDEGIEAISEVLKVQYHS